jgi:hypothetical protein
MFPSDRDAFGHWLSGFADGEACFFLGLRIARYKEVGFSTFAIHLRSDDMDILENIMTFWNAGSIVEGHGTTKRSLNAKRQARFRVYRLSELIQVVIPHFEKYPLRAKKLHDFMIWKEGVAMLYGISRKPSGKYKWTKSELDRFKQIHMTLREQRKFQSADLAVAPPKASNHEHQQTMWS